jgi:hypothetical protein
MNKKQVITKFSLTTVSNLVKKQTKEKLSLIRSKEFFVNKKSEMANSKTEKEGRN